MTVKEMHIEVEQSTQQIAANRGRGWLPEEVDWILNKVQGRFISSCLRPRADGSGGFELDQAKTDHIRQLITRTTLPAYIEGSERYKAPLPYNYSHLLTDWSYTTDLCGAAVPTASTKTIYVTRLRQELSDGTTPFYQTLVLTMPDIVVSIPADLPLGHSYVGLPELTDVDALIPWIQWKSGGLYWEKYDDLYYPKHWLCVRDTTFGGAVLVVIDGTTYTAEVVTTKSYTYHSGTGTFRNNRLTATEMIASLNQSVNWRSSHFSPISELEGSNLYVHRHSSFIVTGVGISYIRKPRPISLSLNSDCELPEPTQQAICDLAVEYIKGTVQNAEGKAIKSQDIAERVTL